MIRRIVVADENRTGSVLRTRPHLRAMPDHLAAIARECGSVPALLVRDAADDTGATPWRWYGVGPFLPVAEARGLVVGGEA